MTDSYIYSILSEHVYRDNPPGLPANWEVFLDFTPGSGDEDYFGAAYINTVTHEIIIAHRGTDGVPDSIDDLDIALGNIPDQFAVSQDFVDTVEALFFAQHGFPPVITHTGHSLGAVLAELNAVDDDTSAVTFESPGSLPIIEDVLQMSIADPSSLAITT